MTTRLKATVRAHPTVGFTVGNKTYTTVQGAARQLALMLAYRVDWLLFNTSRDKFSKGSYERRKRLAKRAYPACKRYVQRWLR